MFFSLLTITTALPAVSPLPMLHSPEVTIPFFFTPFTCNMTFLYCILIIVYLLISFPRLRQWILPCFSSPQTRRTGYASLFARVTSWSLPLHFNPRFFFI